MKANTVSLLVKVMGVLILLTSLVLKGFNIWDIPMSEIITGVLAMQSLVLPIDISKIKSA